jgi:hypothetical protein
MCLHVLTVVWKDEGMVEVACLCADHVVLTAGMRIKHIGEFSVAASSHMLAAKMRTVSADQP